MKTPPNRQRGAVLVISLFLLLLITAIAASTLTSSTFQTVVSTNSQQRETSFRVAESAIDQVLPISINAAAGARAKANDADPRLSVDVNTVQPHIKDPEASIVYAGNPKANLLAGEKDEAQRQVFLPGIALGGEVKYVVRNYKVSGTATTTDDKVSSTVVAGVSKVETDLGGP